MKLQFSFRGQAYETRPFSLFSIAPLLGFQSTPEVAAVTIRGQSIPVQPLTPDQATELADLFGDTSQDAIYEAMHQEETCSMLTRLIYTQSKMPPDWIFWGGPEDWHTDLGVEEISQFIEVFLQPYQSIAEKIVDAKSMATLRRIIPGLPDDLTVTEIGELIALLATEAQQSEAPPPPQPVTRVEAPGQSAYILPGDWQRPPVQTKERVEISYSDGAATTAPRTIEPPTLRYQVNPPQPLAQSGMGVQVKPISPMVMPSVTRLQVPMDEEDLGL